MTFTGETQHSLSPKTEGQRDAGEASGAIGPGVSVGLIFLASVCALSLVLYAFPELDE